MSYLIIANEFSGTDRGRKVLTEVEKYFIDKSVPFTTWKTEYTGHATKLAKQAVDNGFKNILAVGGDGTFNEIINGIELPDSKEISLGLIPSGSGNDFIRNTNLKGSTSDILDYILNNKPTLVDCCVVNGTKFINISGFGFDVDLAMKQSKIKKIFKGKLSYYISLIMTLFNIKFRRVTYQIDNNPPVETDIMLIAVGNGSTYGGGLPITPIARIQDGILDVCIVNKLSIFKIPSMLIKFLKGKHISEEKYVKYFKCKKVHLECNDSSPLNVDGELILRAPCDFEIIHECINIFI